MSPAGRMGRVAPRPSDALAPAEAAIAAEDLAPPGEGELLVVVGPTASGKSDLALALAARWGGEIISADSVQIVRGFDVGSGKPSVAERAAVPHHLVDACDPLDPMDAARFAELADEAIAAVRGRGRVPIVCGGTFLWVKALVQGLAPGAPADAEVRARHAETIAAGGRAALHAELAAVDPEAAARLAPNDALRVSRALEVLAVTGMTQSVWHAQHGFRETRHVARLVGVERPRDALDARLAARIDGWLAAGWVEEVQGLLGRDLAEARAMKSVGYRQIADVLQRRAPAAGLRDAILRATRTFVRRQRTWLRDEQVIWVQDRP